MEYKDKFEDVESLKKLLRETVMRARYALPENKQDQKWFNDTGIDPEYVGKIFDVLDLGRNPKSDD